MGRKETNQTNNQYMDLFQANGPTFPVRSSVSGMIKLHAMIDNIV